MLSLFATAPRLFNSGSGFGASFGAFQWPHDSSSSSSPPSLFQELAAFMVHREPDAFEGCQFCFQDLSDQGLSELDENIVEVCSCARSSCEGLAKHPNSQFHWHKLRQCLCFSHLLLRAAAADNTPQKLQNKAKRCQEKCSQQLTGSWARARPKFSTRG